MNIDHAQPEELSMSSTRLAKARDYAKSVGDQLKSSGGAVLVLRHGKIAGEWYWGRRGPAPDAVPYNENTKTPVYSVTKGFTAKALAPLIQDGILWLDDPVSTYIPEFREGDLAKITVRHSNHNNRCDGSSGPNPPEPRSSPGR